VTPAQRPRRLASNSFSAAIAARGRRRLSVGVGNRQVSGRLVQAPLGKVNSRAHQGQLGVGRGARREGPQQHLDSPGLPVEGQAERMVGEQPGRAGPVARRLGVPDGLGHLAVVDEPSGGAPVQRRHVLGQRPAQLQPEQVPEQVVVAEPRALGVEGDHERVRVFQVQQDLFRARAAGQQVGQFAVDPIQQRGAQQQILDVGGLAVQHFSEQVLGDGAVAAGELGHEPLRVRVAGQGEHREPEAGGPAFGPLVQQRRSGLGQRDARGFE
jgi:hypothetical protein